MALITSDFIKGPYHLRFRLMSSFGARLLTPEPFAICLSRFSFHNGSCRAHNPR